MSRPRGWCRWLTGLCGAGFLLQTGACQLSDAQQTQFEQLVVPTVASVVSDTLFFLLDSAFVRLTT